MAGDSFFGDLATPKASATPGGGSFFGDLAATTPSKSPGEGEYQQFKGGPVQNTGQDWKAFTSGEELTKRPGESDEQFFSRARDIGQRVTPEMIGMERESAIKSLPKVGVTAALAGPATILSGEGISAPIEAGWQALTTQSLKPLMPLARAYIGAKLGGYAGRDIGGLVGIPDIGEKVGAFGGGLAGGFGKEMPRIPSLRGTINDILAAGEEGAAPKKIPSAGIPEVKVEGPVPGEAYNAVPERAPKKIPSINDLGKLIEQEGAGTPPLKRNVPIGAQVPAKFPEVGQVPLGNRVAMDVRDVSGMRMNAPEKLPTIPQEEVGRQMGAPPLRPNVPLREQFKPSAEGVEMQPFESEQARLEKKYPDKAIRQFTHSIGEEMVDEIGDDPAKLREAHDALTNAGKRQAAINGGINMVREDGSPIMINDRKASGDYRWPNVLKELKRRGYSADQIIEMSKPPAEAETVGASKPGPQRAAGWSKLEKQAGD